MELKRRYTTMVFPQSFDGKKLALNILLIPRNLDPFVPYVTGLPAPDDTAVPFADLKPSFQLSVVKGVDEWPVSNAGGTHAPEKVAVVVDDAVNKTDLLHAIADSLGAKINSATTAEA